jgi:hypothetical protein
MQMAYKTKSPKRLTTRRGTTPVMPATVPRRAAAQRRATSKRVKATGKNW